MCELSIDILISCQHPKKGSCLSLWGVYMTLVLRRERFCTLEIWGCAISNFCYLFTLSEMVHKLKKLSGYMFPKNKTHIKSHILQSTVGLLLVFFNHSEFWNISSKSRYRPSALAGSLCSQNPLSAFYWEQLPEWDLSEDNQIEERPEVWAEAVTSFR